MMRIGMVLDGSFPPDPRVFNEARQLIEHGFEVHLFCMTFQEGLPSRETIEGIEVYRSCFKPWVYSIAALAHTIPIYGRVLRPRVEAFMQAARPDAVHCHDMQIGHEALRQARRHHIPFIIDLHENRPEIMKLYQHVRTFPGNVLIYPSWWKRAEERLVREARAAVTVTQRAKDELVGRTAIEAARVIVLPNTVSTEFYESPTIDNGIVSTYEGTFVILYVGDTGIRRGLLTAIDALPELSTKISRLKLVILGASKADGQLKKRVKFLGIERLVDFEGWVHQDHFGSYLRASDVGISPLHRNPHHDMTLANKLAQYMSFGVPLVVSDCTEQVDLVERWHCGLVHEAENVAAFRDQMLRLHNDRELRETLGGNGQKAVQEAFNWSTTSKPLIALYRQIAGT